MPMLVEGQRLDQPTFHELYERMPEGTWAELIDGVVHMSSPAGPDHSRSSVTLTYWFCYYRENTPGVDVLDNASTALDFKREPQPDAQLRILPECGGRTRTDRKVVRGVPELIAEVSHTSRYIDLGPKFDDYERVGVLEYIVRALEPDEVLWFVLRQGRLVQLPAGPDGIFRSTVFPGLWLDPQALIENDTRRLRAVLDQGLASAEHAEFVARLAAARAEA
jgi:hypothetical protein